MKINELIKSVSEGENIFVTGQAGTGKTYLLNKLRKHLEKEDISYELAASTGIAAIGINGTTIHRLFGLGISSSVKEYEEALERKTIFFGMVRKAHKRIVSTDIIIIDEASMISSSLLELIHYICVEATGSQEPFGGKQLILFGDFLQLPPINDNYAFESQVWDFAKFKIFNLTKVHRQDDKEFINILSKIRLGISDEEVNKFLIKKINPDIDVSSYTKLYAKNKTVDNDNDRLLKQLKGDEHVFTAEIEGNKSIVNKMITPEVLKLKENAKVISTANHEELDYVNGSIGKVLKITSKSVTVEFENGSVNKITSNTWEEYDGPEIISTFKQIPLKLAYAMTIHKSQGQTIDGELFIDSDGMFEDGQMYVALSRIKDHNKLILGVPKRSVIKANKKAIKFYNDLN